MNTEPLSCPPSLELNLLWNRRLCWLKTFPVSVPRSQSQCWTSSPGYGSECLLACTAFPEEDHRAALQTHTHNQPTAATTAPPPGSLLPSFNSDVVDLKATHLFSVSFFFVVRLFFYYYYYVLVEAYEYKSSEQRFCADVTCFKKASFVMERSKKTAGLDDVCQASFYILIMCKYDDETI